MLCDRAMSNVYMLRFLSAATPIHPRHPHLPNPAVSGAAASVSAVLLGPQYLSVLDVSLPPVDHAPAAPALRASVSVSRGDVGVGIGEVEDGASAHGAFRYGEGPRDYGACLRTPPSMLY